MVLGSTLGQLNFRFQPDKASLYIITMLHFNVRYISLCAIAIIIFCGNSHFSVNIIPWTWLKNILVWKCQHLRCRHEVLCKGNGYIFCLRFKFHFLCNWSKLQWHHLIPEEILLWSMQGSRQAHVAVLNINHVIVKPKFFCNLQQQVWDQYCSIKEEYNYS